MISGLKQIFIVSLFLVNVLSVTDISFANEPMHKLSRGVVNVVTGPVEIPREIRSHWIKGSERTYHIIVWVMCGAIKGIAMTPARMASGLWDIVSFPFEVPGEYRPLKMPEYVFQDWPEREVGVTYKNLGDK